MNPTTPFYQHDGITIYCADWRELVGQFKRIGVEAVITDPPYGIGVTKMTLGNGVRKIYRGDSEWDNAPPSADELKTLIDLSQKQIFWGGNYLANNLPPSRSWLVWDKLTGKNSFADCELAWTSLDTVVKKYTKAWVGGNSKDTYRRVHPTQKPVSLMHWCIELAEISGVILDPYMGSGSTLRAALDLGLPAIGCEIDEVYCAVAVERLKQKSIFRSIGPASPNLVDEGIQNSLL